MQQHRDDLVSFVGTSFFASISWASIPVNAILSALASLIAITIGLVSLYDRFKRKRKGGGG